MAEQIVPPFSARNRGAKAQIDNAFLETARNGLLHLLYRLVELNYVAGWQEITGELKRIVRASPGGERNPREAAQELLLVALAWDKVFDFCERLYSYLTKEVGHWEDAWVIDTQKSAVQEFVAAELQRLFLEENLAFEFSDGSVRRRGRRNTANQIVGADLVLGDPRFASARAHYNKALKFFRNVSQPDYENVVEEAVCAVEAVAKVLFRDGGRTLGKVVNSITGSDEGQLPEPIARTFQGLYGFRNSGEGVAHGGSDGGTVTKELAEYALAVAASQIVLLADLAESSKEETPF